MLIQTVSSWSISEHDKCGHDGVRDEMGARSGSSPWIGLNRRHLELLSPVRHDKFSRSLNGIVELLEKKRQGVHQQSHCMELLLFIYFFVYILPTEVL